MSMLAENGFYNNLLDHLYDGVFLVDCNRKITYWNSGAEKLTGYKATEVVGKLCSDNILMHVSDKGRHLCKTSCPTLKTISDGRLREKILYLHHKAGHRVPVMNCVAPIKDQGGEIIGAVNIFSDNSAKVAVMQRIEELQAMALSDPLTQLGNRRYAEMNLQSRLDEMRRYEWKFGALFIDIDNYKRINDTYGHEIGDKVLLMVARTLMNNVRSFDTVTRWGGEEFVAMIVNVTAAQLLSIAEKLCVLVAESGFAVNTEEAHITVSIGATLARTEDTVETLIKRADELMYRSKAGGGNRVTAEDA